MTRPTFICVKCADIPCAECVETACPDCEQPACPGFGCIGRVRLERHPFERAAVCRVPTPPAPPKPTPAIAAPEAKRKRKPIKPRPCWICSKTFTPRAKNGTTCKDAECRKKAIRARIDKHRANWTPEKRLAESRKTSDARKAKRKAKQSAVTS